MRIVYILTSLGMGGAERQTLALASRMQERGHTLALLVLRPKLADEWPTSLPTVHLDMRRTARSLLLSLLHGQRFLRKFHPDLVHSHSFHANLVARLLRVSVPSPRLLCTIHNVYEGGWHRMLLYRVTDPLATCTTAVSAAAMRSFVCKGAVPNQKCVVVCNGIGVEELVPSAERRARVRMEMSVGEAFIWLAAGRIVPAKDLSNLLRAFALLRGSRTDARLWIAGATVGAEFERVRALALRLGLSDSVCWLGLRRDLPALLDAADGFVLASAWEGMPLVIGEAMAMEKVVAATDVGGVRELAGEAALLATCRDPEALAEAMLKAMRMSATERWALGRAARARIVERFDVEERMLEWDSLYSALLTQKPS